ncbi:MAG: CotH kinase family protein [Lachnospiraceae bacterium]|nr:CotH kinase family protein [Lachnospiraceae bacterium]
MDIRSRTVKFIIGAAILTALIFAGAHIPAMTQPSVELSHTSGFYDEGFELSIKGKNGRVYYTLDGSRPGLDSIPYEGPVRISDASENENVYCLRTDVTVSFMDREIHEREAGSPEDYRVPTEKIDKCTVVRAVCIDSLGGRSKEACASYFVGFDKKSGYDGIMTLSITTDPENLFDYDRGIYVTGRTTDEYLRSGKRVANDDFWWWWPANYRQKGSEWEREARVQIFDASKKLIADRGIGIRVQGGGSRGYIPRSLSLSASDKYGEGETFGIDLFDMGYEPRSVVLFSGGDSRVTKLEDYLPSELSEGLDISTAKMKPAVMFLDGEFWGVYFLMEKFDEDYFEAHYNVEGSEVVMIKEGELSLGRDTDLEGYRRDMAALKSCDAGSEAGLAAIEKIIDLDSYMDYYALQLFIDRRNDWPYMNVALWKVRRGDKSGNPYADGRWRWILFDDNSGAYGVKNVSSNSIENTRIADPAFDNLMKSEKLSEMLKNRMLYIGENNFEKNRVLSFIADYREKMAPVFHNEYTRFYGDKWDYDHAFDVRLGRFEKFFDRRYVFLSDFLKNP